MKLLKESVDIYDNKKNCKDRTDLFSNKIEKNNVRKSFCSKNQCKVNSDQLVSLFSCMRIKTITENTSDSIYYMNEKNQNDQLIHPNHEISSRIDKLLIYDIENNSLRLTQRNLLHGKITLGLNEHLIVRRNVTLYDYSKFEGITKFKVCLNIMRYMVFKNNSNFCNASNIKNIFFYQVFKKFENFYSVHNNYWNHSNLDANLAKEFIKKIESAYFGFDLDKPFNAKQEAFVRSYNIKPRYLDDCL